MFKNEKFEIQFLTDRIYRLKVFEGAEIEADDANEMGKILRELSNGKPFAVLLNAMSSFYISPDANKIIASKKDRIAAAIVTKSLANRIIGNFFIKFNKPATPTKLFSEETEAMEWLEQLVKEHKEVSLTSIVN